MQLKKSIKKLKKGGMVPYFAYGSNLDLPGMARRTPTAERGPAAVLKNWKLTFRGCADIERSPGDEVVGGIWFIDQSCLSELDHYEGYPWMYDRLWVEVATEGASRLRAVTYVMTDQSAGSEMMPSGFYLNLIIAGYHAFGLDITKLSEVVSWVYDEVDNRVGVSNLVPDGKKRMRAPWERTYRKPYTYTPAGTTTPGMTPATRRLHELEERSQSNGHPGQEQIQQGYTDSDEVWLTDTIWDCRVSGISEDRILDVVMGTLDEFRETTVEHDDAEPEEDISSGVRVA